MFITLTKDFYEKVYTLLVEQACAEPSYKEDFIRYFTDPKEHFHTLEWRFQGRFGFGGKFWRQSIGHKRGPEGEGVTIYTHYISYYPENYTKELDKLATEINESLMKLTWENKIVRMALLVKE